MKAPYPHLMSPVKIGSHTLKSHLISLVSQPPFLQGPEQYPTDAIISHYISRVRHGVAMVTLFGTITHQNEKAKQITENLLQRFPQIDGVFSPAGQMSIGVAEAFDEATLASPPPMEAYGLLADLELDGMIALEIGPEDPPPVVASLPWAAKGAVAYRVRWEPVDEADLEAERASIAHRVARGRATPLVVAVARAVHAHVGGEITDMMGFVVDPAHL